jgi:hypothetical protein
MKIRITSVLSALFLTVACSTLPSPEVKRHVFPREGVFLGEPERLYDVVGTVRSKATWSTLLLPEMDEQLLCRNYYNRAAQDLLGHAKKAGGDAVMQVRSVVFLLTGKRKTHPTPECSDDGETGEILLEGVAIRYRKPPLPVLSPRNSN